MSEKRGSKPIAFALLIVLSALLATVVATLPVYADEGESGSEGASSGGSNDEGTESNDEGKSDNKNDDDDKNKKEQSGSPSFKTVEEAERHAQKLKDEGRENELLEKMPTIVTTVSDPEPENPVPVKLLPNESSNPIVPDKGLEGIAAHPEDFIKKQPEDSSLFCNGPSTQWRYCVYFKEPTRPVPADLENRNLDN